MNGKRLALAISFMICFFAANSEGSELKFVTQEFEPFHYTVGDGLTGPGAEIIRLVCGKMTKTTCSIRVYPWSRAQKMVREGKAHAMFLIGKNEAREKWLWFSHPVIRTEYGIFVREENPLRFEKPSDIRGYKVGVYGPSNTSRSLEKIRDEVKDLTIEMSVRDESCFKKLSIGRVDAVYSNRDVGLAHISKLGLKNVRYAGMNRELDYHVGFSMEFNDKQTVDEFNAVFKQLSEKGAIREVLARYHMTPSKSDTEGD